MQVERDELLCSVVQAFVEAKAEFADQMADYRRTGKMNFGRLDRFVEHTLFTLKEDCHFLFRKATRHQPTEEITGEGLFDICVGSVFHELMKIKENVYQIEYYAPLYSAMGRFAEKDAAPSYERAFLEASRKIVRRARRNLTSDLTAAEELFRDAADSLKMMLCSFTANALLPRTLIDEQEKVRKCFDLDDVDELLAEIYAGKLDDAHLAAARDYLEGGWYDKAAREAKRVLEMDPENIEAKEISRKLSGKIESAATPARNDGE